MIMDGHPLVKADVTYPPSIIATRIRLAVMAQRTVGISVSIDVIVFACSTVLPLFVK